jgi:FixJ family two-component response regulator
MKPLIFFVDDEPMNLTVFEAALPDDWDVKTFHSPMKAFEAMESLIPCVIVSDQRMPDLTGVRFLELSKRLHPNAVRIIATGYSDEDLVVESVRKAQIFDYIRKPWDPDDLAASVRRAVDFFKANEQSRALLTQLQAREVELATQNARLTATTADLKAALEKAEAVRRELEAWAPPFILDSLDVGGLSFPIERDLVGIAFDIVDSSEIHGQKVDGQSLRKVVLRRFTEILLANGGWRESHAGDSGYGHFGLCRAVDSPVEAALATAREFRVALRGLSDTKGVGIECGIAVHLAPQSIVDLHAVNVNIGERQLTLKSFDTSSIAIDALHRMEKLTHALPGSNIIISGDVLRVLQNRPANCVELGECIFKGQRQATSLHLLPSDKVRPADLDKLRRSLDPSLGKLDAAA